MVEGGREVEDSVRPGVRKRGAGGFYNSRVESGSKYEQGMKNDGRGENNG
jgi:hypothetical protein